jgi:pimeloyl-ACP methyl ester carboxylesterase
MGEHVRAGELDVWTEQVGVGSDVLLIGGLGDTIESWQFQLDGLADRYRLTAFDNRGAGRTAIAGGRDMTVRPALWRAVAELIPGAQFEVLEEEAHQPFQEVPDEWNARVDAFWCEVEARG